MAESERRSEAKLAALALSTALLFAAATGGLTHSVLVDRESVSATLAGNVGAGNTPLSGPIETGNAPETGPGGAGNAPSGAGNAPGSAGPPPVSGELPAEAPVVRPSSSGRRRRSSDGPNGGRGGPV
ncbi:hypothetical protein HZS55_06340 [Halosimplex rubrum]|uniref:Uncharacterized protein n=1 Tax=Halosimplex rubrum TaxID=869889 RepID=A0A7D5T5I5_9EURY|nr:hypothetical protein [Halosimplex rubrum]QLH76935.1 hypothetical protein HZS55_06340 [Halosimplex rubrum]